MRVKPTMECRFKPVPKSIAGTILLLLVCQALWGCPSFRIEKATEGAAVRPPPSHFVAGKTTLAEVLKVYGAPVEVVDMKDRFSLRYQHAFYRGGQFSFSIPLSDILSGPSFGALARFQRYDSAVFVFTVQGVLAEMSYRKDSSSPLWKSYWE